MIQKSQSSEFECSEVWFPSFFFDRNVFKKAGGIGSLQGEGKINVTGERSRHGNTPTMWMVAVVCMQGRTVC